MKKDYLRAKNPICVEILYGLVELL